MRILFTRDLSTANNLIEVLAREHDVGVLSIRAQTLENHMRGVQIMPVAEQPRWLIKLISFFSSETVPPVYLSGFAAAAGSFRPDILVLMECNRADLFQALRYKRQNPSCGLMLWTETKRLPQRAVTRLALRFFLWVVRVNIQLFSDIITYTGEGKVFWRKQIVGRIPISVIPSVVDTERFFPEADKAWMPEGKLRVIMNARFVSFKRHQDLIAALALLRERSIPFSTTFIGNESPQLEKVKRLVSLHELSGQVTFSNPLPHEEMRRVLVSHDVLVLPSYNEALGLVVPEAMASGVPTITSDTVGANAYVSEGKTGFIFKTYDVLGLANCLERIADPNTLARMGHAAREHVVQNFTEDVLRSRFTELLSR